MIKNILRIIFIKVQNILLRLSEKIKFYGIILNNFICKCFMIYLLSTLRYTRQNPSIPDILSSIQGSGEWGFGGVTHILDRLCPVYGYWLVLEFFKKFNFSKSSISQKVQFLNKFNFSRNVKMSNISSFLNI